VQGKIISFNELQKQGIIIADDGVQYVFNGTNWSEQSPPKAGDNVIFSFDSMGGINAISYQQSTSQFNVPPPIPENFSNHSRHSAASPSLHKDNQNGNVPPSQGYNSQNFNNQQANNNQQNPLASLHAEEERYNIIDWTKKVILANYVDFSGRARRKEYWWSYLGFIGLMIGAMIIDAIIGSDGFFYGIFILGLFLPSLAVTVRRLHDVNRSGWNILWGIIPIIGAILLIIWLATDTSPQDNRWGVLAKDV
jgi:uncharacterized membrane protein YhaH (DUF805 family)